METNAEQLLAILRKGGESTILEMINERVLETRFIDFKTKSDGNGAERLNKDDKKNYAKALSGFANAEGGILIWGVGEEENENGIKVASVDRSITCVKDFVRRLNEQLPNAVTQPIDGVFNFPIYKTGSKSGFAVTYVPQSHKAPHKAEFHLNEYFLRVGDNCIPMEHYQLEDMFGRRQRPYVTARFNFTRGHCPDPQQVHKYDLEIELKNEGRNMASFVGVDFEFPALALERENSPQSFQYKIDMSFDTVSGLALVKLRHNSRQAATSPMFPGETIKVIPSLLMGSISYHVNNAIHSAWQGKELNVTIYADSTPPRESTINFSDLNQF